MGVQGNKRPTIEGGGGRKIFLKEARPSITGFPLQVGEQKKGECFNGGRCV